MSDIPILPVASPAMPAARPSYFRTQTAPFVFGVAVGGIWFWEQFLLALTLDSAAPRFTASSAWQAVAIVLAIVAAFFVWPAAAAVWSTVGDARFWGVGAPARARAWLRLALALLLAFALGGSVWLLQVFAPYGGNPRDALLALGFYLAPYPDPPFAPMMAGFAFMIGLLAAFAFARWPVSAARLTRLTQVARWIVVGALAAIGAFLVDSLLVIVSYTISVAIIRETPTAAFNLSLLSHVLGPVPPAAVGGLIGGLLRAGLARPEPAVPAPAPAPMPTVARRIPAWVRWAGAVGTGLLLGLCWVGALLLTISGMALLLVAPLVVAPPVLLVALGAWRGRDFWMEARDAAWRRPVPRLMLALTGVLAGVVPDLVLLLAFSPVNGPIILALLAPPVFSASLAIGFAWGRGGGRGWWSAGTRAALLGALGYSLCFAGLIVSLVIAWVTMPPTYGHGLGGAALAFAFYTFALETLGASLFASFAFAALGGVVGAALRVAPAVE